MVEIQCHETSVFESPNGHRASSPRPSPPNGGEGDGRGGTGTQGGARDSLTLAYNQAIPLGFQNDNGKKFHCPITMKRRWDEEITITAAVCLK